MGPYIIFYMMSQNHEFCIVDKRLVRRKINPKIDVEIPVSQTFSSQLFVLKAMKPSSRHLFQPKGIIEMTNMIRKKGLTKPGVCLISIASSRNPCKKSFLTSS